MLTPNSGDIIYEGTVGSTGEQHRVTQTNKLESKNKFRHISGNNMQSKGISCTYVKKPPQE